MTSATARPNPAPAATRARAAAGPIAIERDAEGEFIRAMDEYKARSGRMFPTWSEVLEVLRELGYEKPGLTS